LGRANRCGQKEHTFDVLWEGAPCLCPSAQSRIREVTRPTFTVGDLLAFALRRQQLSGCRHGAGEQETSPVERTQFLRDRVTV
jgi:hypothetical protein